MQPLVFAKWFLSSRLSHFGHHSIPIAPSPRLSLFTFLALLNLSIYCHSLQISGPLWTCVLGFPLCMCVRSVILFTTRKPAIIYRFQTKRKCFFPLFQYIFLNNSFLQEHFRSFFLFSPHRLQSVCAHMWNHGLRQKTKLFQLSKKSKNAHRFLFSFLKKKRKGKIVWSQSSCISIYCDHKMIFFPLVFTLTLVTRFQVSFLYFLLLSTWFVHLFLAYFVFIISTNQIR